MEFEYINEDKLNSLAKSRGVKKLNVQCAVNLLKYDGNFMSEVNELSLNGKKVISVEEPGTYLLLNYLSEMLKTIANTQQSDKDLILRTLIQLLREKTSKFIYRLDIKKFYESIHPEIIYNKVFSDLRLSPNSKKLILLYLNSVEDYGFEGIGRGTTLSGSLAEYFLEDFDKNVKKIEGVYFYARFVDDIIIFSFDEIINIQEKLTKLLPSGLVFHSKNEKFQEISLNDDTLKTFNYLGYSFEANKSKLSKIDISENKVKKIKGRLVKSLLSFGEDRNEELLLKRLKFITGNRRVEFKNGRSFNLGLYHSYKYIDITNSLSLREIDRFYRSILYSKKSRIRQLIKVEKIEKKKLNFVKNLSFKSAFLSKPIYSFEDIKLIKRCWTNAQ